VKKKKRKTEGTTVQNIMFASATQGGHKNVLSAVIGINLDNTVNSLFISDKCNWRPVHTACVHGPCSRPV